MATTQHTTWHDFLAPCYCDSCSHTHSHTSGDVPLPAGHRRYGVCSDVWPNCPQHGVCSWCGVYVGHCKCVGGPTHD